MSELLSQGTQGEIVQAIRDAAGHLAFQGEGALQQMLAEAMRPSAIYRPRLYRDGNEWCALYGDNLQTGVCGFGLSPAKAMDDFDRNWISEEEAK